MEEIKMKKRVLIVLSLVFMLATAGSVFAASTQGNNTETNSNGERSMVCAQDGTCAQTEQAQNGECVKEGPHQGENENCTAEGTCLKEGNGPHDQDAQDAPHGHDGTCVSETTTD